jgi:cytochrome c biogenesis protein CcdA
MAFQLGECNAVGCFLERNGGLVSLPLVTLAGIVDGLNPCAIGMLLLLLGYLIVFAKKPEKVLRIGGIYIASVFMTYLTLGLLFYKGVATIQQAGWFGWMNLGLGLGLLAVGLIQI